LALHGFALLCWQGYLFGSFRFFLALVQSSIVALVMPEPSLVGYLLGGRNCLRHVLLLLLIIILLLNLWHFLLPLILEIIIILLLILSLCRGHLLHFLR